MNGVGTESFNALARSAQRSLADMIAGEAWSADSLLEPMLTLLERARLGALVRTRASSLRLSELDDVLRTPVPVDRLAADDPTGAWAYAHSVITLGFVPAVPPALVSWPAPPSSGYRDLVAPRGPLECAERLEHLERVSWTLFAHRAPARVDLRRLYAFFEAGALWTERERWTICGTDGR